MAYAFIMWWVATNEDLDFYSRRTAFQTLVVVTLKKMKKTNKKTKKTKGDWRVLKRGIGIWKLVSRINLAGKTNVTFPMEENVQATISIVMIAKVIFWWCAQSVRLSSVFAQELPSEISLKFKFGLQHLNVLNNKKMKEKLC